MTAWAIVWRSAWIHIKNTKSSGCEKTHANPHLPGLALLSLAQACVPAAAPASSFTFIIVLLINKGVGFCCCFVYQSKQACSKFKHCKLSLALGTQTWFSFLLAASNNTPTEKPVGDGTVGKASEETASSAAAPWALTPMHPTWDSARKWSTIF